MRFDGIRLEDDKHRSINEAGQKMSAPHRRTLAILRHVETVRHGVQEDALAIDRIHLRLDRMISAAQGRWALADGKSSGGIISSSFTAVIASGRLNAVYDKAQAI